MTDSYLAPAPALRQLDGVRNGIHSSTARESSRTTAGVHMPSHVYRALKIEAEKTGQTISGYLRQTIMARLNANGAIDDDGSVRNGIHSSTALASIKTIEAERRKGAVTIPKLCAEARVHPNTYRELRLGNCKPSSSTLRRLTAALQRIRDGQITAAERTIVQSLARMLTAEFARRAGADPQLLLSQSFEAENTNDPTWLQASRMRRRAIYILAEVLEIGKAKIARAVGVSRQAVQKTVAAVESERMEDVEFDAVMQAMTDQVKSEK